MAVVKVERRVCDGCKREIKTSEGSLLFKYIVKDYLGNGCANGEINLKDLCGDCCKKIRDSIEGTLKTLDKE